MAKALNTFTVTDLVNVLTLSFKTVPKAVANTKKQTGSVVQLTKVTETEGSTAPRQLSFGPRHPTGNQNDFSELKSSEGVAESFRCKNTLPFGS